jgi:predicted amidophosphoribosyltransferase
MLTKREALRLQGRDDIAVCLACRERWERAGSVCALCHAPVRGARDVGVLLDRHAFGHADCGGVQLAR